MEYFRKMKGSTKSPPGPGFQEIAWSWLGAFLGIAAVAVPHYRFLAGSDLILVIGSFGASAVLLYGAPKSPLAQPRNLLGGHIFSAFIGVFCYQVFQGETWLAAAFAVATAIAVMHLTRTLHPPGGATALIAVIGGDQVHALGYLYALLPAASGAAIMLIAALFVNNIPKTRKYPEFWF